MVDSAVSRRRLLTGAGAVVLSAAVSGAAHAFQLPSLKMIGRAPTEAVPGALMRKALAAIGRHRPSIAHTDRIGIVDFSVMSRVPRFHIIDMMSGNSRTVLVAHGRGSDPEHRGWLERFSNDYGSNASSAGAYVTGETYDGKHGQSRRLIGLDPTNNNAEIRAIVIHAASYVSKDLIATQGKIGRSEGCLAVAADDLDAVLGMLGQGRLIYANRREG